GERYSFASLPAAEEGPARPRECCVITPVVRRAVWETVRGYDEGFASWGYGDVDFRHRAVHRGYRDWWLGGDFVFLNHGAEDSTRFYRNRDKQATAARNLERLRDGTRPINPDGFGRTE